MISRTAAASLSATVRVAGKQQVRPGRRGAALP